MELLYRENQQLAEGPLWHRGFLYWVDIKAHTLHRINTDNKQHEVRHFQEQITSISLTVADDFVLTSRHGLARLRDFNAELIPLVTIEDSTPDNRFNDAKVDVFGNLWAGTMDDNETDSTGALYRIAPNFNIIKADTNYYISNGPTFSPESNYLYHTDSALKKIYRFKLTEDGISDKQTFIILGDDHGHPDGMTVDVNGCIWVCEYGGWGISCFDARGEFKSKVELPVSNVTSCTFGGINLDTLFITTAAKDLSQEQLQQQPLAGSIFQVSPGVSGAAPNMFKG